MIRNFPDRQGPSRKRSGRCRRVIWPWFTPWSVRHRRLPGAWPSFAAELDNPCSRIDLCWRGRRTGRIYLLLADRRRTADSERGHGTGISPAGSGGTPAGTWCSSAAAGPDSRPAWLEVRAGNAAAIKPLCQVRFLRRGPASRLLSRWRGCSGHVLSALTKNSVAPVDPRIAGRQDGPAIQRWRRRQHRYSSRGADEKLPDHHSLQP